MEKKLYQTKLKIEQELSIEINNLKDLENSRYLNF